MLELQTQKVTTSRQSSSWERAVKIEDGLNYGEPPEWFYPVRESLGAALLTNGEADRAEAVFRADLRTVSTKSPVAVWASEESGSPEEDCRRGRSSKRIRGGLEERGRAA